ncbi:MAG: GFA family protein [Deltaproteobacteria bacterium]|nr:GFA family protein [Deltaproteobacteria bacterium]
MQPKPQENETMQEGGCLCGAIRYRVKGSSLSSEYCHCGMCRRASGAPVVVWVDYLVTQVTWLKKEPALYRSSAQAQRGFCPHCGSALLFLFDGAKYLSLTTGTLDNPGSSVPGKHIYYADRVPWFDIADSLPRHAASPPKKE